MSSLRSLQRKAKRSPRPTEQTTRAPVVIYDWTEDAVEIALGAGLVMLIDDTTGEAFAISMGLACEAIAAAGFESSVPKLQSTPRPFVRIDARTPDRIVVGTLLQPRQMSAGGCC